ncbi:MAG TPA: EamA family transporter, partial [Polyangiaceae bacterium]|nr:EamA family transporter [Polyangiaceae bacterium]
MIACFAAVWVVWGSTYLAIRFTLETIPPLLMAGARYLVAGSLLFALARARGAALPAPRQWRSAALLGLSLFVIGNGSVIFAETRIASGAAALLIATEPLMIAAMQRERSGGPQRAGLLLGLLGVVTLLGPSSVLGAGGLDPVAVVALLVGALSWAAGSLYGQRADLPADAFLASSMQMLVGGVAFSAAGAVRGEAAALQLSAISFRSAAALAYLVVFGSMLAFSAYGVLVRHVTPSKVSTYAYVNPVVAVLLGALLGGEALSARFVAAGAMVVAAVVLTSLPSGASAVAGLRAFRVLRG